MSEYELFITVVEKFFNKDYDSLTKEEIEQARSYFEKKKKEQEPTFTENGLKILSYLQKNSEYNKFTAKDLAERLKFPNSRVASGSLKKLISDGYLEKVGEKPTVYKVKDLVYELILPSLEVEEEDN